MALTEKDMLKALDDLEQSTLRKGGDALANAPHDGGLATQGENIQSKAKTADKAKKAMEFAVAEMVKEGMPRSKAFAVARKAFGDSDAESEDEGGDYDSSSVDGDSPDGEDADSEDTASEEEPVSKSTGAAQLRNASSRHKGNALRKGLVDGNEEALEVTPVLKHFVDVLSETDANRHKASKRLQKSLEHQQAQIDAQRSLLEQQADYNRRLAQTLVKAFTHVSDAQNKIMSMVQDIHGQPVVNNRPTTLRRNQLQQPHFGHSGDSDLGKSLGGSHMPSVLERVPLNTLQKAMVEMAIEGKCDSMDVTKFENSRGADISAPLLKALEERFPVSDASS